MSMLSISRLQFRNLHIQLIDEIIEKILFWILGKYFPWREHKKWFIGYGDVIITLERASSRIRAIETVLRTVSRLVVAP